MLNNILGILMLIAGTVLLFMGKPIEGMLLLIYARVLYIETNLEKLSKKNDKEN
jgi:hypothetical protein